MYATGRKYHRIETAGRRWLSEPEPYMGCSAIEEEEEDIPLIFTASPQHTIISPIHCSGYTVLLKTLDSYF
jgi:hypothetical protein